MRTRRRYTNTTFTHRVDHEAGRKRPPRAPSEPRICGTCGAVYRRRRWITAEVAAIEAPALASGTAPALPVVCPACRKTAAHTPNGYLHLEGRFLDGHVDEVLHLVHREAARAAADNPTGRIIAVERGRDARLTVTTTTEHLAERLGHAVSRAYDGQVRFDFSHENKLARVYWHRD